MHRVSEQLINVTGLIVIAAILAGLAYYVEQLLKVAKSPETTLLTLDKPFLQYVTQNLYAEITVAVFLILLSVLFGWAVHVNRYSLHAMYRDRLIRTFLAATRRPRDMPKGLTEGEGAITMAAPELPSRSWLSRLARKFQPAEGPPFEVWQFTAREQDLFTDFDRNDNPLMQWLRPTRRGGQHYYGRHDSPPPSYVKAPLLVVNCALNMVGEANNAIQERKAASFTVSPLHAGSMLTGYRPVAQYGGSDGLTLGTAMTISGAAVSPNAGQRSNPVITFLLALFNVRLGWWLGNPESSFDSKQSGPLQSLGPLTRELLGRTDSSGTWIYLSDGGHFENLGLYEMVRRGCRYIVVVDASADPDRTFESLGNAIRKIRIDLSIEIRQKEKFLIGGEDFEKSGRYVALFDIEYPWDKERAGQLLYIKTAIYRRNELAAPLDVVEYGSGSIEFPHEPTSDQFFMETQFESYRALGEHEITSALRKRAQSIPGMFVEAVEHIRDPFENEVDK